MYPALNVNDVPHSTVGKGNVQLLTRLTRLLVCGTAPLLREAFDWLYPPSYLPAKLKNPETEKELQAAKLTKPQWNCLYPSPGVYGKSKDFDFTLLYKLLRAICGLTPPSTGWDAPPAGTDQSLTADLVRIKCYCNLVYGYVNQNMEITDGMFTSQWQEISQAMVRIAGQLSHMKKEKWQEAIDNFLKDPLTAEDEKNAEELLSWYRNDVEVKESLEDLKKLAEQLELASLRFPVEGCQSSEGTGARSELKETADIPHSEAAPTVKEVLDFDDDTLTAMAEEFKDKGNDQFRKKKFSNAIHFYTEGIKVNCKDDELNAKLYSNRATANFQCGNYNEAVGDAKAAVQLQPTYLKAIVRGALACTELDLYEEAIIWCEYGLAINKSDMTLLKLKTRAAYKQAKLQDTNREGMKHQSDTKTVKDKECDFKRVEEGSASNLTKDSVTYKLPKKLEVEDMPGQGDTYADLVYDVYNPGNLKKAIEDHNLSLKIAKVMGDVALEGRAYANLGNEYHSLGVFNKSIEYHNLCLIIAKEMGDRPGEGRANANLGNVYRSLGDYQRAIQHHECHLKIATESEDLAAKGCAYGNLGNAYYSLGDFRRAKAYHECHLAIAKEVGDRAGEGRAFANLGNDFHSLGLFEQATDCYEHDLHIAKEVGDKAGEGRAYGNLGNVYCSLGRFTRAIEYHKKHLRIAKKVGDRAGEACSLGSLGNAFQSVGDLRKAIDCHSLDLKIAQELGDRAGEGRALNNLGNAFFNLGDFKRAKDHHELSLSISKQLGSRVDEGGAYANLGNDFSRLGDFEKAVEYHNLCLKISKEVEDKAGEGKAYGNLGNALASLGDYKTALDYYNRALQIAKDVGDRAGVGITYGNLGSTFNSLGDYRKAMHFTNMRLAIAKELGDRAGEGSAYGNVGNAYRNLGDLEKATKYLGLHLQISQEIGDRAGEGRAYGNLGNAYYNLRNFKRAIEYHSRHLALAKELGDRAGEGCANANLGIAYHSLKDFPTAIEYHRHHLGIAMELRDKDGEGRAHANLGNAYFRLGNYKRAIEYHERHLQIVEELGDKIGQEHACANLASAFQSLGDFQKAIMYHKRHVNIAKEAGDINGEAYALYDLGCTFESNGFLHEAKESYQSSVKTFDDAKVHLRSEDECKTKFCSIYRTFYTALWKVLLKLGEVQEALFVAEQERVQALNNIAEFKYGLALPLPLSGSYVQQDVVSNLSSYILSEMIFLEVCDNKLYFWVYGKGQGVQFRMKEIADQISLENVATPFQSLIQKAYKEIGALHSVQCENHSLDKPTDGDPVSENLDQMGDQALQLKNHSLQTLYNMAIGPIADLVEGSAELLIVPDGQLCSAPFAALLDPKFRCLSESFRIRVIPSLTSLKLIADSPDSYHCNTGALLIGDPQVQEFTYQDRELQQLPCAKEEVEMIGRILNTAPLTGTAATKDAVLQRLSSVALVHIAAHVCMETGEIALAPNPTRKSRIPKKEDYLLTMKDVLSAKLRARLVVLSCCHSGRGEVKSEGVVGIARAFLGAGARSVLVALWAIDDEATLEFMKCFYQGLAKGKGASEALNRAMKSMRESEKFKEVKYWAPFVLIGDDVTLTFGASD